jgi:signal transduction histidine kinase
MTTTTERITASPVNVWHEIVVPQGRPPSAAAPRPPEPNLYLLRYFTVIGLVSFLVVTAVLAVFYRRMTLDNLVHLAEDQNVVLTQTFANSLWPRFALFLPAVSGLDAAALRKHPEILHLKTAVMAQMRHTRVVRVKVYGLEGRTVFSTEPSQIGSDQSANPGVVAALAGATKSELTYRNTFNAFDREIEHRNVLASYVPIRRSADGPIEGVFELYDDVTPLVETTKRTQRNVIGVVSAVLAALFGALCLAARHADRVIRRQREARAEADRAREKLEAQLRHKQRIEAIGTLAGGIAHDFNNMLSVILACSELGAKELARESPVQEKLKEIKAAARRGSELVQQILTFSRQESRERKPVRVSALVEEALRLLDASLPSSVRIERRIATDAGSVLASPSHIHQMVINLVTNAAHASGEEGGVLRVGLAAVEAGPDDPAAPASDLRPGPYVKLTVSDSGCGMDGAIIGRIFDPFFTTKDVDEGVGMGLAIVHGIVAGMDGVIRVRSAPGRGSTFEVFLPRCDTTGDGDSEDRLSVTSDDLFVDHERQAVRESDRSAARPGDASANCAEWNGEAKGVEPPTP